ncbi:hypothetical protein HF086_005665 [Spodoptera exigua]|uniref:Uncharacterized protein n=1 Tax=Spodoptera exigua TaxID=7107 RepID=A0A922MZE3_SPOEX|nr:hypothetical protein HF086_005665 [Spodoptera exigua]
MWLLHSRVGDEYVQDLEDLHINKCTKLCTRKCSTSEEDWCVIENPEESMKVLRTSVGTIGGNLSLKNQFHDFPSDVFLLLATVGATITVVNNDLSKVELKTKEFLTANLKDKLICDVKLPPLSSNNLIRTFKIMPRAQNAHAIMNAGFLFKLDTAKLVKSANIIYGNISPTFIKASQTESLLVGQNLFTNEVLLRALRKLEEEITPVEIPGEPSASCRKTLALGLFYKAVLSHFLDVNPRYKSGGSILERPVSKGTQSYETDKTIWPLNKPVPKLEALAQKLPGIVAVFSAKDIPGRNSFTPNEVPWMEFDEEIFASKNIHYYGQPIGVVAAVTRRAALAAAELVKVKYKKLAGKPLRKDVTIEPTSKGTDIQHTITGTFNVPPQYHYTMETQSCTTKVTENGLVIRSATQWMDLVHVAVSKALNIDENRILVEVPRVGGAYGGKASRSSLIACACALVAHKLNRSATLVMPLTQNMEAIGARSACEFQYECGVNNDGVIQYLNVTYYSDCGCNYNDSAGAGVAVSTTEGIAFAEHIMERISHVTKKDHVEVRLKNLSPQHDTVREMISSLKMETNFDDRKVEITKFNQENAWKKRGLKLSIMSYPIGYSWNYPVTISVYHGDGTVDISHGGIEMGQGINTKIAQVCAYALKVPLEKVTVKGSNSFVSPNSMVSNGSLTSDSVAYATLKACEDLNKRLKAATNDLFEPTWEQIVNQAYQKGVNLQATYMTSPNDGLIGYNVYGVCAAEVELDVLTGNHVVRRLDLLEDTGVSMSPEIDVGQIEGAFIMGLGLWTSERLVFEESSGRLLTNRTWTYKPPGAKDIPVDFRIMFRRNSSNPAGVLRSKATGEPALTLAVVVTHVLHDAIVEARSEFGYNNKDWLFIESPYNVENILKAISHKIESFKLT